MSYKVGVAKTDITAFVKGVGMMGYGMWFNKVQNIETPLFARAFVIQHEATNKKVAYVNAEIAFITIAIKKEVVKRLQASHPEYNYTEENVFLSAQHTHSGPGGYSHYALYNMSVPGFVPQVFETFVAGIVKAIVEATQNTQAATLSISKGKFEPNKELAINRSVKAWNQNPEVEKLTETTNHLGVDLEMTLLNFINAEGSPIGSINWFGVHTTSVHNDNKSICSDNKGYAATFMEQHFQPENNNYIAAFAQRACGDISPNYFWDTKKKWTRGKFENCFESAAYNGKLQFEKAAALAAAENKTIVNGIIDHALVYVDFSNIHVDREFAHGVLNARTDLSCHGVAFFAGTVEGPGMPPFLAKASKYLALRVKRKELKRLHHLPKEEQDKIRLKYETQGNKDILIETGEGKILGTHNVKGLPVPGFADPSLAAFKRFHRNGSLEGKPWIPQILSLHIVQIGQLALVSVPGEITTVASWRLRNTLKNILATKGIEEIIICSYTDAFCGYFTTYEEYQMQCYEGGHTVFGEHQLGALQTKYKQLAQQFILPENERNIDTTTQPPVFTEEEIMKRSFGK
jgi:neutral ceramidase